MRVYICVCMCVCVPQREESSASEFCTPKDLRGCFLSLPGIAAIKGQTAKPCRLDRYCEMGSIMKMHWEATSQNILSFTVMPVVK